MNYTKFGAEEHTDGGIS